MGGVIGSTKYTYRLEKRGRREACSARGLFGRLAVKLLGSVGAVPPTPFLLLSLLEARSGQDQRPLGHPQGSGHQDILAFLAQPSESPVGVE